MFSTKQKCSLIILNVGHGSAAVLHDEGGVVVFDTGRGAHVGRHLSAIGQREVEAMFLSHADVDHIGGAITLLLNPTVEIRAVFLNPDASKDTDVFMQLRVALCDSEKRSNTRIEPSLTTSTTVSRSGAKIEVLHPPATSALGGVGGKRIGGGRNTSNSLSAAIRVTGSSKASVLLGGDVEYDCVEEWKRNGATPSANALIFPHHGGLPGAANDADAELFAYELTKLVNPSFVIFSIHRRLHTNPRDSVVAAVIKAVTKVQLACTQLPDRLRVLVEKDDAWRMHRDSSGAGIIEGNIELVFTEEGLDARIRVNSI